MLLLLAVTSTLLRFAGLLHVENMDTAVIYIVSTPRVCEFLSVSCRLNTRVDGFLKAQLGDMPTKDVAK